MWRVDVSGLQWLQLAASAVFLGRAWQHFFWDAPFRSFFWDEAWLRPLVEGGLGWEWSEYVTSPATEAAIDQLTVFCGVVYLLCGLGLWLIGRFSRIVVPLLYFGVANLILLAGLYYKEHFYFTGQFFEYTLQWASPLFLIFYFRHGRLRPALAFAMKVAIALTFTCHGLYAIGWYPRPGYFMQMTMSILGLGTEGAVQFLRAAAWLDFAVSLLVFLPGRYAIPALAYATFWGFLTTAARIVAHFHSELWWSALGQWTHEALYRFPHFLIPAFLLWRLLRRPGSPRS